MMEEKERQRQLKMFVEDKEEIAKKRERVLSACGLRPPTNLYESPKIVSHTKNETPNMQKQPQLPPRKE